MSTWSQKSSMALGQNRKDSLIWSRSRLAAVAIWMIKRWLISISSSCREECQNILIIIIMLFILTMLYFEWPTIKHNTKIKHSKKLQVQLFVIHPHSKENIDGIEKIQRRAARFTTRNFERTAWVAKMINDLGWPTLQQRRQYSNHVLFYRVVHHRVAAILPPMMIQGTQHHSKCHRNLAYQNPFTRLDIDKLHPPNCSIV